MHDPTASRMSAKRKAASGSTGAAAEDGDSPAAKRRKVPVRESLIVTRWLYIRWFVVCVGDVEGLRKFLPVARFTRPPKALAPQNFTLA